MQYLRFYLMLNCTTIVLMWGFAGVCCFVSDKWRICTHVSNMMHEIFTVLRTSRMHAVSISGLQEFLACSMLFAMSKTFNVISYLAHNLQVTSVLHIYANTYDLLHSMNFRACLFIFCSLFYVWYLSSLLLLFIWKCYLSTVIYFKLIFAHHCVQP